MAPAARPVCVQKNRFKVRALWRGSRKEFDVSLELNSREAQPSDRKPDRGRKGDVIPSLSMCGVEKLLRQ